ncbi:acyl-CoA dehydrogenase family protein [Glutamicibacter protophormiae]|uniref:Dibenzothiophene monooxygenase n=1 Tax=Glutamicibacter protophormiae TaxID=37930 RepID=A0ABS4XMW2_GLUPR|nr:acyl-CoA dehydrogenase family protein [Glutamicibacter protophormiae]MBP2397725.1 alkylation response protein AidB-like acyl-CoA dehydrogenase [Glutamicibacter protophormiae]GGL87033.1 putative monooxygenase [Glutamicibacter protophormiae]
MTVTALPRVPYAGTASETELEHWRGIARQVAGTLAADALARDRANAQPFAEVRLLREAGLLDLLAPAEFGGAGGHFETAFEVIRILAAADGSISQLLAYHYINQSSIAFYAPAEAQAAWWRRTVEERWLWGDSVNPVDPALVLTREGAGYRLNGTKRFSTGSGVGEVIVVNAQVEGTGELLAFVVPRDAQGLEIVDDWDYLGQRLSASNSLVYRNVRIEPADVLGPVTDEPVSTLLTPGIQLAFANFYVGIAQGALERGKQILLGRKNAWFLSAAETYSQDPVFQRTVGELKARTAAVAALAEKLGRRFDALLSLAGAVTQPQRAELAVAIAELKVVATEAGVEVANRIFEVTGSSSTQSGVGLDLFWRNVRTHSLHDPVDYKKIEVGAYFLRGESQPLSLYT